MDPSHPSLLDTLRLVTRAQEGQDDALESLFRRYLPRVTQIAAVRLGTALANMIEVEDIVQETMTEAFKTIHRFDGTEGKFINWLATITENRIRDRAREASTQKRGGGKVKRFADGGSALSASLFAGREATPSQNVSGQETENRMHAALLSMDDRYREVILQRTLCEMSFAEIAAEMGFEHEGSARKLHSRALEELSARLKIGDRG